MGGGLWQRLVRALKGQSGADAAEAERILLEADFGVAATDAILGEVTHAPDGDFRKTLERAVTRLLSNAATPDPGALARAPAPPTVILVFGVNGVG